MSSRSLLLTLDWHPLAGHFRTSAGFGMHSYRIDYMGAPDVDWRVENLEWPIDAEALLPRDREYSVTIRDREFEIPQSRIDELRRRIPERIRIDKIQIEIDEEDIHVRASIRPETTLVPYFGIGWGSPPVSDSRWRYSIDLGAFYSGRPQVEAGLGGEVMSIHPLLTKRLNRELHENQRQAQAELDEYRLFPHVSIGVSYLFN